MDELSKKLTIERSMPVNARIDLTSLVKVGKFMELSGGTMPKSLSQLVNWSIKMLDEIIGDQVSAVNSLSESLQWLEERGYKQKIMRGRSTEKLPYALAAENLRNSKIDPAMVDKFRHNHIHGVNRENYDNVPSVKNVLVSTEEVRRKVDEVRKKKEEIERLKEKALKNAMEQGLIIGNGVENKVGNETENNVLKVKTVKEKFSENDYMEKCQEISRNDELVIKKENEILSPENLKNLLKE